jgi:hypothetical protein
VDADVLHLHGAEIELAGPPGVLVAAAEPPWSNRDEQPVLALFLDDRGGDAGDEIERVVPRGRMHLAVAPDHRVGEALLLGLARRL